MMSPFEIPTQPPRPNPRKLPKKIENRPLGLETPIRAPRPEQRKPFELSTGLQELLSLPESEKQRRREITKDVKAMADLDRELLAFAPFSDISAEIETMETMESLTYGEELDRDKVREIDPESGKAVDVGINSVSRRFYDGDPIRTAYVKGQNLETSFSYIPGYGVIACRYEWDQKSQEFTRKAEPYALESNTDKYSQDIVSEYKERQEQQEARRQKIADYYNIPLSDVPEQKEHLPRKGVAPGKTTIREVSSNRIDLLVNFGTTSPTCLRGEQDPELVKELKELKKNYPRKMAELGLESLLNTDICSVQEGVTGEPMDRDLYEQILKQGPAHPGAKSFMRLACMHWLRGELDGHPENIFYHQPPTEAGEEPAEGIFKNIDAGLSQGLAKLDPIRSVPLEVVQKHPNWTLDQEAIDQLKELYASVKDYLELKDRISSLPPASGELEDLETETRLKQEKMVRGKEFRYLSEVFRAVHKNENIARKEAIEFFKKVSYLITNGRPPRLSEEEQFTIADKWVWKPKKNKPAVETAT